VSALLENADSGMKTFGLTGGVGMGKSTAAELLHARGVKIADTDQFARELVQPGQPALAEIQKVFGSKIIFPDGRLRRGELAKIVFADDNARKKLEEILHPRIRKHWLERVENWRKENCPLAVVVIPLLFETRAESYFDKIICVACAANSQCERLLARGWTSEQIQQRKAAQWPIEGKINHSDFVVWTEGGLDVHAQQIDRILSTGNRA
jgi:dephospho-CoA kinase